MVSNDNSLSIIIPAYNEEDSLKVYLPELIKLAKSKGYYLILVNDGSKDNTKQLCESFLDSYDRYSLINNKVNKGYGGAIKEGVLHSNTKFVITIDADGQHNFEDVDKLLAIINTTNADMIVGSRKGQQEASMYRGFGKKLIRSFAKFLIKTDIYDINSGMKIYRSDLGKQYLWLCPNGMSYSDTILLCFINFRHKVLEEPIKINSRISGESTIGTKTAIETIKEILNLVVLFNPLKIFIPISILLLVSSLLWGIPLIIQGKGISVGTMLGVLLSVFTFFIGLIAEQISHIRKTQIRNIV